MTPRTILLAWAESGGFAATHGAGATNDAIVDDLLAFLAREGVVIVPREPTERMCDMALVTPDEYAPGPDGTFIALTKPADVWRAMIDEATESAPSGPSAT